MNILEWELAEARDREMLRATRSYAEGDRIYISVTTEEDESFELVLKVTEDGKPDTAPMLDAWLDNESRERFRSLSPAKKREVIEAIEWDPDEDFNCTDTVSVQERNEK